MSSFAIWCSDWHAVEVAAGENIWSVPSASQAMVRHINQFAADLIVITGDLKQGFGSADDAASFRDDVYNLLSPTPYCVRGNHDEDEDVGDGTATAYTVFDAAMPALAYRFTADWTAASVRFIGFHCNIEHTGALVGTFSVSESERTWIAAQLTALPTGWKAILCTHPPLLDAFGNNINSALGGTELLALMATNASKVAGYLGGHRHADCTSATQDGILHVNGGAIAYTLGDGFMLLEYDSGGNTITIHYRYGAEGKFYGAFNPATYTPLVISL